MLKGRAERSIIERFKKGLHGELRLDRHGRAHGDGIEQFANVLVLQGDAAPGPIAARAVAMNVDGSAQPGVLRWSGLRLVGADDRVVLRFSYQAIAQTPLGMREVRIADSQ